MIPVCVNGFRTKFQASALGAVSGALDAANSLFGGVFGQAADLDSRVRSAAWERAHDNAFAQATQELKPEFIQSGYQVNTGFGHLFLHQA